MDFWSRRSGGCAAVGILMENLCGCSFLFKGEHQEAFDAISRVKHSEKVKPSLTSFCLFIFFLFCLFVLIEWKSSAINIHLRTISADAGHSQDSRCGVT